MGLTSHDIPLTLKHALLLCDTKLNLNVFSRYYIKKHQNSKCICPVVYGEFKCLMYLPNIMDWIQIRIFRQNTFYEHQIIPFFAEYINTSSIIADMGANIGNHSIVFSKLLQAKKVYAFEPVAETFNVLKVNIELNALSETVTVENLAIGAKKNFGSIISSPPNNAGGTEINYNEDGELIIITLDDYFIFDEKELPNVLKIDVEGFELEVLKGGYQTITIVKPTIFIEIWKSNYEEVNSYLERIKYKQHLKIGDDFYIYLPVQP